MTLSIIVAVAHGNAMGYHNQLPWHIAEDLKCFKALTTGATVVMGRKTFESIGKPLPNRTNIVISRTLKPKENVQIAASFDAAMALCQNAAEVFVIGGASIYQEALATAHRLYLTEIDAGFAADTFFPELDTSIWKETSRKDFARGENFVHPFSFVVYERR